MIDELTRTALRATLADLAEAQRKVADPDTPQPDFEEAERTLPDLRRTVRLVLEEHAAPDPPEPEAVDLLADPANVAAALDAPDPAAWLADEALRRGERTAGPEALARVLRAGHRDEAAPADLVTLAARELARRERAARRAERLALLEAGDPAADAGKLARERLRCARTALDAVRTMRPVVSAAEHAAPVTDWTGTPPDREWLLHGWLAVGRVHLLTGRGGRGKSLLSLQLAAALAAGGERWPVPWRTADARGGPLPTDRHPVTLPPAPGAGGPVVVASWEDEPAEVHRRLHAQPVPVEALGGRLHYVDAAEWGPLWAPTEGSRHVQTVAELTAAGRRLRRLCERVHAHLLVVDPLAAAYGSDENVRGLVRQYMASWDAWGRTHGCAVLMIAHPPKGSGNGGDDWWSGSTDWPAAARSAWALEGGDGDPRLTCHKASYGVAPEPVHLAREGVTWYATWPPPPKEAADGKPKRSRKANGAGTVGAVDPAGIA